MTKVREVDDLVGQIAAASKGQSQGIAQVNTALSQIDKVTRTNADNAKESAGASEELNAQASVPKDAVRDLMTLVGGVDSTTAQSKAQKTSVRTRGDNPLSFNGKKTLLKSKSALVAIGKPGLTSDVQSHPVHPTSWRMPLFGTFNRHRTVPLSLLRVTAFRDHKREIMPRSAVETLLSKKIGEPLVAVKRCVLPGDDGPETAS